MTRKQMIQNKRRAMWKFKKLWEKNPNIRDNKARSFFNLYEKNKLEMMAMCYSY